MMVENVVGDGEMVDDVFVEMVVDDVEMVVVDDVEVVIECGM